MENKSNPIIIISVITGILLAMLIGILVFFNLPAQRIRRMLKTTNKYIAEENYDEAILTLQKMLEIDPKNENLYILLADTYEKNGDTDKEIEFLQEAVTLMPENEKISEVLFDLHPEVTLSESSGTYTDPVSLSMSAPKGSEIFYNIVGNGNESKYSSPIDFGKNGKYTIEYYAVSKTGYEGEHKTATYVIKLDESKYHFNEWVDEADGRHFYDTDGVSVTGWQEINGKRYYFNESGTMLKDQWIDDTYYVGADGALKENDIVQIQQSINPAILYSDTVEYLILYVWDGATEEKYESSGFQHKIYDPLYFTGAGASDRQKKDILNRVISLMPEETGIPRDEYYHYKVSKEQGEAILSEILGASYNGSDYVNYGGDYGTSWPTDSVTSVSKISDDIYGVAGVIGYENDASSKDLTNFYATVQLNPSSRYGVTILSIQTGS